MKNLVKILLILSLGGWINSSFGCDDGYVILNSETNNGDGTYTYNFTLCIEMLGLEGIPDWAQFDFKDGTFTSISSFSPPTFSTSAGDVYTGAISGSTVRYTLGGAFPAHSSNLLCNTIIITTSGQADSIEVNLHDTYPSADCYRTIQLPIDPVGCDYTDGTVSVSASGFTADPGFSQTYVLVENASDNIVSIDPTGSFSGLNGGQYRVYAVNYEGAMPGILAINNLWATVAAYDADAANCFDAIGPKDGVINVCEPLCYADSSITVSSSGFTADPGYSQTYVLVNENDSIYASNLTGSFSFAEYGDSGVYSVYAVNTNDAGVSAEIADAGLWSEVAGMSGCLNYIGGRLYDINTSFCPIPTSINNLTLSGSQQPDFNQLNITYSEHIRVKNTIVYRTSKSGNLEVIHQTNGHLVNDTYKDGTFDFFTNHIYRVDQILVNGQVSRSNLITLSRDADLDIIGVFPVPTNDLLNIHFNSKEVSTGNIHILDMMGRTVMNKEVQIVTGTNKVQIDVINIESGVYHLVLNNSRNRVYKQIIVEH